MGHLGGGLEEARAEGPEDAQKGFLSSSSFPLCRRYTVASPNPHTRLPLPWDSLKGTLLPSAGSAQPLPALKMQRP